MKVLFIVFEFQDHVSGGLARVINGLTPELCKHVEVDVLHIYTSFWKISKFNVYKCNQHQYARITRKNKITAPWNVLRLIEEEDYDLIHFFYVDDTMERLMSKIRKRFPGKKIVYSVHSLIRYEKNIRVSPESYFTCELKMMEQADLIHVLNKASLSYFKDAYPVLSLQKDVSVISNGLDEQSFVQLDQDFYSQLKKRLLPGAKVVISLTRWAPGKGLEFLLEGAGKLLKERKDVQFVIAGRKNKSWEKGGDEYVRKINEKVASLSPHVLALEWLNESQRNSLFELADLYVMPSELEYFSYASLEPLIYGIPLVQSKIDCLQEMLMDGEDCLFYEARNTDDLCRKLLLMIEDPKFANWTAENGSEKLKRSYRWPDIARQYVEMYRQVLSSVNTVNV